MKTISVNTSIYELVKKHPEIVEILFNLGFEDITKPMMLNTVGRIMNLKKGSKMRNIEMPLIKEELENAGFTLTEEE